MLIMPAALNRLATSRHALDSKNRTESCGSEA